MSFSTTTSAEVPQFCWPSDGYIYWKWRDDDGINSNKHNGIDIWTSTDSNNGGDYSGNAVYPVMSGYATSMGFDGYNLRGLEVKHSDNLYTYYWHLTDVPANLVNANNVQVDKNTIIGYQGYAVAVHLHMTVSTVKLSYDSDNADTTGTDPTPYFSNLLNNLSLAGEESNSVPAGYYVSRSTCANSQSSNAINFASNQHKGVTTIPKKLDFNGDGKSDLVQYWNDGSAWSAQVYLSNGSTFNSQRWATKQGGYWEGQKWLTGDFNGDKKTDFVNIYDCSGYVCADVHYAYVPAGQTYATRFEWKEFARNQGGYWSGQKWFVGNFNGDRYDDIAKLFDCGGQVCVDVHVSNGSSFTKQAWAVGQGGYWAEQKWFAADVNGDAQKRTDLVKIFDCGNGSMCADAHISNGSSFSIQRWASNQGGYWTGQNWFIGDVDAQNGADLINVYNNNGIVSMDVHLSTTLSFWKTGGVTNSGTYESNQKFIVADFNGDRKVDVAKVWNHYGDMSADVYQSLGSRFERKIYATQQWGVWPEQVWFAGFFDETSTSTQKADLAKVWNANDQVSADVHFSSNNLFSPAHFGANLGEYRSSQVWLGGMD